LERKKLTLKQKVANKKKATIEAKKNVGMRFNDGKLRWRNFPPFLLRPLMEVAQYGETKYKTFNFLDGMTCLDSMDCTMRHIDDFMDPMQSDYDLDKTVDGKLVKGSQCHHLAHAAWNLLVCLFFMLTRPELDDRWKGPNHDRRKRKK